MKPRIYARVSTEQQEKQETIQSQLSDLREYARKSGNPIQEEHVDDGYSGELLDRPALDRLRDDARRGLFDTLLVHSPDRLSRTYVHGWLLRDELAKYGVKIVYLNRPERKDTPEERFLENMEGVVAEYEKAKILERTRRGKLKKARGNNIVGGPAPYGYRYVPSEKNTMEPGHYKIINSEAKVVRLIFSLLLRDRMSIRGIARELTRRSTKPRQGKHWRTSTLHKILTNNTYIGMTHHNKNMAVEPKSRRSAKAYRRRKNSSRKLRPIEEWVPIKLPKSLEIIDKRTFHMAQKQLETNAAQSPRNVKYQYLLRGKLECGECESPFQGTPCHGVLYYRCGNRNRTFPKPKTCPVGSVRAEPLEKAVWDKICEAIRNPRLIASQIEKLRTRAAKGKGGLRQQLENLDREISGMNDEEDRVLDLYREKVISVEKVREQIGKVQDKRKRLGEERECVLAKLTKNPAPDLMGDDVARFCQEIGKRLKALSRDFEGRRCILDLLVDKIVLKGKTVRIRGAIPAVPARSNQDLCRIASTTSWCYGLPRGAALRFSLASRV